MRLASGLFIVLVLINVIFAPFGGFNIFRVSALLVYLALSYFLWHETRIAALAALLVSCLGALLLGGAIFFLWPIISDQLRNPTGLLDAIATLAVPILINLIIVVVLVRALLSNQRLERP